MDRWRGLREWWRREVERDWRVLEERTCGEGRVQVERLEELVESGGGKRDEEKERKIMIKKGRDK